MEWHDVVQAEAGMWRKTQDNINFKTVREWVPHTHSARNEARATGPHGRAGGGGEELHEERLDELPCRGI